jgi:hypothetical protein
MPLAAPIAFHPGAELVERHGAEHRDPLAEHPERHPQLSLKNEQKPPSSSEMNELIKISGALAALAPDPRITLGLDLGDSSVVCHPGIKA